MSTPAALAYENIHYLRQATGLLAEISDASYCKTDARCFRGAVGGHMRHCIDHYRSFLTGLRTGMVDYDDRARDPLIETDRASAMRELHVIVHQLSSLAEQDLHNSLLAKMDGGEQTGAAIPWTRTTVGRELQFLISHTVHHFALMAVMLRLQGFEPDAEFGIAPSTLRHQRDQQPCALPVG